MAVCKSAVQEKLLWHILMQGTKSSETFISGLIGALKLGQLKGGYNHTGSFPSIASIHSRLLASERACRVMTPCLRHGQRQRAAFSRCNPRDALLSVCFLVSPLDHLNVKTEAFVDRIPLSSDTRAQPEHLRSTIHHTVLLTGRVISR